MFKDARGQPNRQGEKEATRTADMLDLGVSIPFHYFLVARACSTTAINIPVGSTATSTISFMNWHSRGALVKSSYFQEKKEEGTENFASCLVDPKRQKTKTYRTVLGTYK